MNDLLFSIVMIFQVSNTNIVGTATGFFFKYNDDIYLITNRHVVEYSIKDSNPKLIFNLHKSTTDLTQLKAIELPLKNGTDVVWYGYKETDIDVVAIPVNKNLISDVVVKTFSEEDFPPSGIELPIGSDLLVIGYPRGFSDKINYTPIAKSCIISTPTDVPFEKRPFFLMDGNLFPGMSGSPVITKPSSTFNINGGMSFFEKPRTFFLGIHSASVSTTVDIANEPIYELKNGQISINGFKKVPISENLELQTCWYNSIIFNLIKSIKK